MIVTWNLALVLFYQSSFQMKKGFQVVVGHRTWFEAILVETVRVPTVSSFLFPLSSRGSFLPHRLPSLKYTVAILAQGI